MPFAAIWMDQEIIILSELSQTEKDKYYVISFTYGIHYYTTNESMYKTETDSQTQKTNLWSLKRRERDASGVWD